jgi:Pyruvate/2-oxoacid:ferredoxin oxidoreductase delta subunit/coenzyme F420-reducing hydrogenase delta subunit
MAGEVKRNREIRDPGIVLLVEQNARTLLTEMGLDVIVLEAQDWAGPDSMVVHPATVDRGMCAHCLACIKLCPSLSWDPAMGKVVVNEVSCKGCGICGSVCPTGAISQRQFSPGMILDTLGKLWGKAGNGWDITSCGTCPVEPLALNRMKLPHLSGSPVRVICSGRVEPLHVLETAQMGVGGLLMVDCFFNVEEKGRFERGKKRLEAGVRLLHTLGSHAVHTGAADVSAEDLREFQSAVRRFATHHSTSVGGGST